MTFERREKGMDGSKGRTMMCIRELLLFYARVLGVQADLGASGLLMIAARPCIS